MENHTAFKQYEIDKDIPNKVWNNYLKKYSDRFIVRINIDGINYIKCYNGMIVPYSLLKGYLLFVGDFPSSNKKTYFLKRFKGSAIEITLDAHEELSFKFKESLLLTLHDLLKIKDRMNLSIAEKERRKQNMLDYHKKRC